MASKTDIAVRALGKLGQPRVSNIDTTDTKNARVIRDMYDNVRDAILAEYPWNFSLKRAQLAKHSVAPSWGFSNAFTLPSDFLALCEIRNNPDYRIELDNDNSLAILTNEGAPLYILYIQRVTDVGRFPALFVEAFAARLALEGCEQILESNTKKQILFQEYEKVINSAFQNDAIQDPPQNRPLDDWVLSRNTSYYDDIDYNTTVTN